MKKKAKKRTRRPAAPKEPDIQLKLRFGGVWIDAPATITRYEIREDAAAFRHFVIEGWIR